MNSGRESSKLPSIQRSQLRVCCPSLCTSRPSPLHLIQLDKIRPKCRQLNFRGIHVTGQLPSGLIQVCAFLVLDILLFGHVLKMVCSSFKCDDPTSCSKRECENSAKFFEKSDPITSRMMMMEHRHLWSIGLLNGGDAPAMYRKPSKFQRYLDRVLLGCGKNRPLFGTHRVHLQLLCCQGTNVRLSPSNVFDLAIADSSFEECFAACPSRSPLFSVDCAISSSQ